MGVAIDTAKFTNFKLKEMLNQSEEYRKLRSEVGQAVDSIKSYFSSYGEELVNELPFPVGLSCAHYVEYVKTKGMNIREHAKEAASD